MKITASAPARIDLSGGATDWCGMHTLAMAIDLRAYATVEKLADSKKIIIEIGDKYEEYTTPEYNTGLDLFKAVIELSGLSGFKVSYRTDIPKGSGLGGSAPLTVSTLFALKKMFSKDWSKYYIAELAQRAETLKLETVQGYQDQYTAVFGNLIFMDFEGKECQRDAYSKPISEEPYAAVEDLSEYLPEFHIVLAVPEIDRGSSDDTNGSLSERFLAEEKEVVIQMHKKAKLTQDAKKVLIEGNIAELYKLINANNEIMQQWGFLSKYNLQILEKANALDAKAVKTCGAGRGGMAIFAKDGQHQDQLYKEIGEFSNNIYKVKIDTGVRYE